MSSFWGRGDLWSLHMELCGVMVWGMLFSLYSRLLSFVLLWFPGVFVSSLEISEEE